MRCTKPEEGTNTNAVVDNSPYSSGDQNTYTCQENFKYTGDPADLVATCLTGGTWSQTSPECTGKRKTNFYLHAHTHTHQIYTYTRARVLLPVDASNQMISQMA